MRESIEFIRPTESIDTFRAVVDSRKVQLDFLTEQFESAMGMIEDIDTINGIIAHSVRPELVMTQAVPQMPIESPYKLGYINNSIPLLCGFGVLEYEDRYDAFTGEVKNESIGRETPDREALDLYFFMGARGGYGDYTDFASENGINIEQARDMLMNSHTNKEAFMRMWILFPELTEQIIITAAGQDRSSEVKPLVEEIFVAYQVMSRLVDIGDKRAIKDDGTLDDWLLCH